MTQPRKKHGGRAKGTPNKNNAKTRDELWAYVHEHGKTNPLKFLLDTVHDKKIDYALRVQCAKEVLPYMASKLLPVDPSTQSAEQRIKVTVSLAGPSDD